MQITQNILNKGVLSELAYLKLENYQNLNEEDSKLSKLRVRTQPTTFK